MTDRPTQPLILYKQLKIIEFPLYPPPIRNTSLPAHYKSFNIIYRVATNFINALKYAKGDTIYFSDQDDVWLPNKVRVCESNLKDNVITIHRRTDVDSHLSPLYPNYVLPDDTRIATFLQSLKVSHFQGACMAFTKELKDCIIQNLDLFYNIPLGHDHAIGYVAQVYFPDKIHFEPSSLILYRRHEGNVSPTGTKSKNSLDFKILYRVNDVLFYSKLLFRKLFKK